jgi:hypothetical protein
MGDLGQYSDEGKEWTTGKSDFDSQQGQKFVSSPQWLDQVWDSNILLRKGQISWTADKILASPIDFAPYSYITLYLQVYWHPE